MPALCSKHGRSVTSRSCRATASTEAAPNVPPAARAGAAQSSASLGSRTPMWTSPLRDPDAGARARRLRRRRAAVAVTCSLATGVTLRPRRRRSWATAGPIRRSRRARRRGLPPGSSTATKEHRSSPAARTSTRPRSRTSCSPIRTSSRRPSSGVPTSGGPRVCVAFVVVREGRTADGDDLRSTDCREAPRAPFKVLAPR